MRHLAWTATGFLVGLVCGVVVDALVYGGQRTGEALGYGVLGAILGASVNDFGRHDVTPGMLVRGAALGLVIGGVVGVAYQQIAYGRIRPDAVGQCALLGAVIAVNATLVARYRQIGRRYRP